jgi:hypothetical protein
VASAREGLKDRETTKGEEMAASIANSLIRVSSGLQYEDLLSPKGNPDINQFMKVLRKTTRWAAQWRRTDFDGQAGFGKKVSLTVPRIAELVNGVTLVVQMPDIATAQQAAQVAAGPNFLGPHYGWTNSLGHALIETVELEIGGVTVETLDGRLLEVLDELYEPLDTLKAKNAMIKRAPNGFGPTTWVGTPTDPVKVYVPLPFWFSRPGRYSHALPIDAINADKIRIHVTFRTVEQVYYTDARYDGRTVGFRVGQDVSGAMPELAGGRFWVQNPTATGRVYFMSADMPYTGLSGEILAGYTMPARLDMEDAYLMLEYVSVEEPEAIALRTAELTYFVEQHNAILSQATQNTTEVRIPLPLINPTKEILWVLQRPEAESYNAWFLFSRDLGPYIYERPNGLNADAFNPCRVPWWPDAELTPTEANNWRILPAFRTADSEPITGAAVFYNSLERFEIKGPVLFRTLLPTKAATKVAVHDRYVYMWPFGFQQDREDVYRPAGAANWDKIPRKEMYLSMAAGRGCTPHPNMNVYVWTTNWNVLKVFGGRAGMLFSN